MSTLIMRKLKTVNKAYTLDIYGITCVYTELITYVKPLMPVILELLVGVRFTALCQFVYKNVDES
jgi:hypothetical protein